MFVVGATIQQQNDYVDLIAYYPFFFVSLHITTLAMLSLLTLTENKIASIGAAAMVTGVILLVSASAIDTGPVDDDDDGISEQEANIRKKNTLLGLGESILSIGVLAQVYDQYTRFKKRGNTSSSSSLYRSSSEMSPAELSRFQDRVSEAAAKLRRSIAQTPASRPSGGISNSSSISSSNRGSSSRPGEESAAELAARASAQISSFIQNYS
ncbi:unnamed protein product [Ectocarpus sp. 12 AP-2014]